MADDGAKDVARDRKKSREERLAEALKANLRRRKAQTRARRVSGDAGDAATPAGGDADE